MAEKIEKRTRHAAELYDVDVRQDQRYLAEKDLFPYGDGDKSGFSPDFKVPLSILGLQVIGDPNIPMDISRIQVLNGRMQKFEGPEKVVLGDLLKIIKMHDPPRYPPSQCRHMVPLIIKKERRYGLEPTFSSSDWFKSNASKSYWSYVKVNHKDAALIPERPVLVNHHST